ncbi:hypothetical protein [Methanocella paludicola]|nr:hypothetical protein [Methanocella paludicola]
MASFFKTENLIKLVLLLCGALLLVLGLIGIVIDFVPNLKVDELSSVFVMLSGAAILLATAFVYLIIPEYKSRHRLEHLRQYYAGKPEGEARDIIHNILERSQGIMGGVDIIADNVRDCVKDDMPYGVCIEKLAISRELLEYIKGQSNMLNDSLKQLEDHVKTKKQATPK